jgi:hypothetical protein
VANSTPTEQTCEFCGRAFVTRDNHRNFRRKYCTMRCDADARHARAVATYPPREDVVRLYVEEGLSDLDLGRRYGRSCQWAFKVRQYYGIAGEDPSRNKRKPLRRKNDRSRWGIHLKPERGCRACGKPAEKCRGLNLHHAIPRSLAPSIKYDLRNGLPLCPGCHFGWHRREVTIYRDAFKPDELAFLLGLEFTGFVVKPWLDARYPMRTTS